jgi:hypothetical protein
MADVSASPKRFAVIDQSAAIEGTASASVWMS